MLNTNESGRSMVEMLGVLAIIGVLSIGGIAGYTQAMRRYRANEVLNAISMLAITGKTRLTTTTNLSYEDAYPGSSLPTGASVLTVSESGGTTTVNVTLDDENLCKAVKSMVEGSNIMATSSDCGTSLAITVS